MPYHVEEHPLSFLVFMGRVSDPTRWFTYVNQPVVESIAPVSSRR